MTPRLLSTAELADQLGVTEAALHRMAAERRPVHDHEPVKVGHALRWLPRGHAYRFMRVAEHPLLSDLARVPTLPAAIIPAGDVVARLARQARYWADQDDPDGRYHLVAAELVRAAIELVTGQTFVDDDPADELLELHDSATDLATGIETWCAPSNRVRRSTGRAAAPSGVSDGR